MITYNTWLCKSWYMQHLAFFYCESKKENESETVIWNYRFTVHWLLNGTGRYVSRKKALVQETRSPAECLRSHMRICTNMNEKTKRPERNTRIEHRLCMDCGDVPLDWVFGMRTNSSSRHSFSGEPTLNVRPTEKRAASCKPPPLAEGSSYVHGQLLRGVVSPTSSLFCRVAARIRYRKSFPVPNVWPRQLCDSNIREACLLGAE